MKIEKVSRLVSLVVALTLTVSIGGCATTYQKSEFWGMDGYSSRAISDDTVEIQYMLSQPWNFRKVSSFALLRAADMAIERGFYSLKLITLNDYGVGTSRVSKCTVQFFNPTAEERKLPETADQLAAYDLVGFGIFKSGEVFVASELKRVISAKHLDDRK